MKKIFCVALAACLVFCSAALAFAATPSYDDESNSYYGFQNLPVSFNIPSAKNFTSYLTIYAAPGSDVTIPYYTPEFYEETVGEFIDDLELDGTYIESAEVSGNNIILHVSDDVPENIDEDETYYPLIVNYAGRAFGGDFADDEEAYYSVSLYISVFDYDFHHNTGSTFGSGDVIVGPSSYDFTSIVNAFSSAVDDVAETLTGFDEDDVPQIDVSTPFGSFPAMSYVPGSSNPGTGDDPGTGGGTTSVVGIVSTVGDVFSTTIGFVGTVVDVIVDNPLLLIFVVVPLIGVGVGLTKRLLNL